MTSQRNQEISSVGYPASTVAAFFDTLDELAEAGAAAVDAAEAWLLDESRRWFAIECLVWLAGVSSQDVRAKALAALLTYRRMLAGKAQTDLLGEIARAQHRNFRAAATSRNAAVWVAASGTGQTSLEDVIEYAPPMYRFLAPEDAPLGYGLDVMAVGTTGFSKDAIKDVLTREPSIRVVPLDGLLEELVTGREWLPVDRAEIVGHPGLAYVSSLGGFHWPETEADIGDSNTTGEFRASTPLRRTGYRISGMSDEARWSVLTTRSVPELGLREVVYTIAQHVRLRKTQVGGRDYYSSAIRGWELELERLRTEYYLGPRATFQWPPIEP